MCKLTKKLRIHGYPRRLLDFQNSDGRILQVERKITGVVTPLELCLGTSEIEFSASWPYIMSPLLTLLLLSFNEAT